MTDWKRKAPKAFVYYGIRVLPLRSNGMGFRYETSVMSDIAHLQADTKDGIKELIREHLPPYKLRGQVK
jgi:hypothetical protein